MKWSRRAVTVALVAFLVILPLVVIGTWQIDVATARNRLQRGVLVGSRDVGREAPEDARTVVEELAAEFAGRTVVVQAPGRTVETTAREIGWSVDTDATLARLAQRRDRRTPPGLPRWMQSFAQDSDRDPVLRVDDTAVRAALERLDTEPGSEPREPEVRLGGDRFVVAPGDPGRRIDPDTTAAALARAPYGRSTMTVTVPVIETPATITDAQATEVAEQLTERTAAPRTVQIGAATTELLPAAMRAVIRPTPSSVDGITIDEAALAAALAARVPDPITEAVPDTISVVEGLPVSSGGIPGTRCCDAPGAAAALRDAIVGATPAETPLVVAPTLFTAGPPSDLASIGIVEEIGRFTTPHRGGEPRVVNIHLAADALRGHIVGPGEVLSLNEVLGQRTAARGYVAAPAIVSGVLQPQIGGGVSQLATTTFNAAFFAGFDLVEYQAHSIYISRYPYGREATLYWPVIDLKVRNTTPGSVLVWTEYTDTEITVVLYGTRAYEKVEQGNQIRTAAGACTAVRTERVKTRTDGTVEVDEVRARYRPGEGLGC